jgi:3-hydroxyacyl-CoA dehydrogenase
MSYTLPGDVDDRPIAIDGAGTLGRRIASVYAAGGIDVRILDLSEECEAQFSLPSRLDSMWKIFTAPGIPPFRLMDRVGLDVVLNIEEHYASVRAGLPEGPQELLREMIYDGRLGVKSGHGFYDYPPGESG